ncbi:MAG: CAP domain-containing protein [Gallionella sp.]|nr:CAP domain-containing protein [Gallionella sp.]
MNHKTNVIFLAATLVTIPAFAGGFDTAAFVTAHNKWRAEAGVTEKLSYSPELEVSAQAWADNLKQTNHCRMRHSKGEGRYGENIFWASALAWSDGRKELQQVSPGRVVDSWGSEKADYDYANNSCTPGKMCGHYTQVVWRTTTAVGCAMAVCEDTRQQVWVCQYQPAGNWVGNKPY